MKRVLLTAFLALLATGCGDDPPGDPVPVEEVADAGGPSDGIDDRILNPGGPGQDAEVPLQADADVPDAELAGDAGGPLEDDAGEADGGGGELGDAGEVDLDGGVIDADAGDGEADAALGAEDGGASELDGSVEDAGEANGSDAAVGEPDASTNGSDAGSGAEDAGSSVSDGGTGEGTDAGGVVDAGTPSGVTVVYTWPSDGSTGQAPNRSILVGFSKGVQPASVDIDLASSAGAVPATLAVDGEVAVITPDQALPQSTTIQVDVRDATGLGGEPLLAPYSFSFTTGAASSIDKTAPSVVESMLNPAEGAVEQPVDTAITVVFNEPLLPNAGQLGVTAGGYNIDGTLSFQGESVTFHPASPLPPNSDVYFSLFGQSDLAGNTLSMLVVYHFRTAAVADGPLPQLLAYSPPDGAQSIAVNAVLRFKFDETVTVDAADLSIQPAVQGTFAAGENEATFTPSAALAPNTYYSVVLRGSVKGDTAGETLGTDLSFTFRSGGGSDVTAPKVLSVQALSTDGKGNPTTDAQFMISFDEPISPASIVQMLSDGRVRTAIEIVDAADASTRFPVTEGLTGNLLVATPRAPLPANRQLKLIVGTWVEDLCGRNRLAVEHVTSFTVAAQ